MVKYLINENIHGYEKITVNDDKAFTERDNMFVLIIDKNCDKNVGSYYRALTQALKNNNRVIMVSIDDENKAFKPLASLLITYNNYDIYQVIDRESISAPYLLKLEDREPDYTEVRTYVGGDVTAYSEMSTILFGIENLIDEGNEAGLKNFLEEHMLSIENLTTTLNNMKKTCDVFSSSELTDTINSLKTKIEKLQQDIENRDKEISNIKFERDENKVNLENIKRENEKLKNSNTDLQAQAESGGSVIKTFKEINTQLINCKTKIVLYFKEVSYVPYMNSLVMQLTRVFDAKKLKYKLLIYDTQSEMYTAYNPLQAITGADYISMKSTLISKKKAFVVAEPNPTIMQDMLLSEQCFDVLIVYDRTKSLTDIVTGNNVTKFYVINSSNEYEKLNRQLKIPDTSHIITHANSSIEKGKGTSSAASNKRKFLDIPTIPDYNSNTDAGKISKYMKLVTKLTGVPLIDTIIKKSRIDTLYAK